MITSSFLLLEFSWRVLMTLDDDSFSSVTVSTAT